MTSGPSLVDQPSPVTEVAAAPQSPPPPAIAAAHGGQSRRDPSRSARARRFGLHATAAGSRAASLDPAVLVGLRLPSGPSGPAALAADRPEVAVGAAFAGGLVLALLLKRLAR